MVGTRTWDDVRLTYAGLATPHVQFRQETVVAIDPDRRHVVTDGGSYDADVLVVALGADLAPEATPGLLECGHEFYSPAGAAAVHDVLSDFRGGAVVIGVLGGLFKCPPAPYEAAFMVHDHLVRRGLRDGSTLHLVTPMPKPIPISEDVSAAVLALMDERGITHSHRSWVERLDPATQVVHLRDGDAIPFDLFLGVPVHVAPPVVVDAGLTEEDGWIAVDPATLETRFPGVYAVGDVASVPVPRAGVIAEGEAATLAEVLVHRLGGGPEPAPFAGRITCYMEMGDDTIGIVDVDFLSGPAPVAAFTPPSHEGAEAKQRFAAFRRDRWFGPGSGESLPDGTTPDSPSPHEESHDHHLA